MKARLIQNDNGKLQVLCSDGTICDGTPAMLYNFLVNFKHANSFSGDAGHWAEAYPDMSYYPGETLGLITDFGSLTIETFEPFMSLFTSDADRFEYISVEEFAEKYNKSTEIIKVYCRQGRIVGAVKIAGVWMIPRDASYPIVPGRQKKGASGQLGTRGTRRPLGQPVDPTDSSYVSAEQYAAEHDRSVITILRYCRSGRIPNARKTEVGGWEIPRNAPYLATNQE